MMRQPNLIKNNIFRGVLLVIVLSAVAALGCETSCELYPMALSTCALKCLPVGHTRWVANGQFYGSFAWVNWDGDHSVRRLADSLDRPGDSYTYTDPTDVNDHVLGIGDWVRGRPGVKRANPVRESLDDLKGVQIVVPVWSHRWGMGPWLKYRVKEFAKVEIVDYRVTGRFCFKRLWVKFKFLGYAPCITENEAPLVDAGVDQSISYTGDAQLNGTVSDDGIPTNVGVTYAWSQVSGPGTALFSDTMI